MSEQEEIIKIVESFFEIGKSKNFVLEKLALMELWIVLVYDS